MSGAPQQWYPGIGYGAPPPQPMGLFVNPQTGTKMSARLNPAEALAAALDDMVKTIGEVGGDGAEDDALIRAMAGMSGGKRRRKRMHGGGPRLNAIRQAITNSTYAMHNAAMSVIPILREYAAKSGKTVSQTLDDLVTATPAQLSGIFGQSWRTVKSAAYLLWALVKFGGGSVQLALGVASGVTNNLSGLLDKASTKMIDQTYQQEWADAISKDWPTAALVSVAALTQAGVLSLTTVVAVILRVFGTALSAPGRAAATVAIYLWYLGKPPAQQTEIKKAAVEYYNAAKTVSASAAGDAVAAGSAAAVAAGKFGAAVAGGVAVVASKMKGTQAEAAAKSAGIALPATEAEAVGAATEAATTLAAGGTPAVSAASAEVAAEVANAVASAPAGAGSAAPAAEVVAVVEKAKKGKGAKGGRKTRKVSSTKRRATRRRKPSKLLAAPVFAY
jgi:hypothetical protein